MLTAYMLFYGCQPIKEIAAVVYLIQGKEWHNKGDYNRAIADYNKFIEVNPVYAGAYHDRGRAYSKLGKYKRAIEDYDKAILLDPNIAE